MWFVFERVEGKGNPWKKFKINFVSRRETQDIYRFLHKQGRQVFRVKADTEKRAREMLPE